MWLQKKKRRKARERECMMKFHRLFLFLSLSLIQPLTDRRALSSSQSLWDLLKETFWQSVVKRRGGKKVHSFLNLSVSIPSLPFLLSSASLSLSVITKQKQHTRERESLLERKTKTPLIAAPLFVLVIVWTVRLPTWAEICSCENARIRHHTWIHTLSLSPHFGLLWLLQTLWPTLSHYCTRSTHTITRTHTITHHDPHTHTHIHAITHSHTVTRITISHTNTRLSPTIAHSQTFPTHLPFPHTLSHIHRPPLCTSRSHTRIHTFTDLPHAPPIPTNTIIDIPHHAHVHRLPHARTHARTFTLL